MAVKEISSQVIFFKYPGFTKCLLTRKSKDFSPWSLFALNLLGFGVVYNCPSR